MFNIPVISLPLSWNTALSIKCQPPGPRYQTFPFIALETKTTKYAGNTNQLAFERQRRDLEIDERVGDKSIADNS